jgi:hypothetical protein
MRLVSIRTTILLSFFLLFAAPVCAQKNDTLVMKNGDRLTCEIKSLDAGVLYVSLDYVDGTISVQWSEVVHIESKRLFIVRTGDGSVYRGLLSTNAVAADEPVKFQVAETQEKKVVLDGSQIVRMSQTADTFWQRLNGDISTGVTYAKGNQSAQFNLSSSVEYPQDRWLAQANFNSSVSSNTGTTASTRNEVSFSTLRLLRWKNYFYAGSLSFLQSSEQGISHQTTLGGGIGRYIKNTNRTRISVLGGVAWQRTNYKRSGPFQRTQNIAAGLFGADVKVFKFKKTNLKYSAALIPAITEPGRVYFKTNATYFLKIFGDISWNFSFYGNWDNHPPIGLSGSDYGTTSGLSWSFGNN